MNYLPSYVTAAYDNLLDFYRLATTNSWIALFASILPIAFMMEPTSTHFFVLFLFVLPCLLGLRKVAQNEGKNQA